MVELNQPATPQSLKGMGLQCHLLTGDNWRTARAVAAELGIDHVEAEVQPEDKADTVSKSSAR